MRIHSDTIEPRHLRESVPKSELYLDFIEHGSRSREHAFEVRLEWIGPKVKGDKRRYANQSTWSNHGRVLAATWDEWGEWIARLYEVDPDAIIGPYKSLGDFHAQTEGKFVASLPDQAEGLVRSR